MSDTRLFVGLATLGSNERLFRRCITSFAMTTTLPWRLMVVLDEAEPHHLAWLQAAGIHVDASPERRGLVPAYNLIGDYFLRQTDEPYLVLLDDAVQVTAGWDVALQTVMRGHPGFGWVSALQYQNPAALFMAHCSMQTRVSLSRVGILKDPAFAPEQFDDMDALMRFRAAGFTPTAVPTYIVHDIGRSSQRHDEAAEIARLAEKKALFTQKWGVDDFDMSTVPVHLGCEVCGYQATPPPCHFCYRKSAPAVVSHGHSAAICRDCLRRAQQELGMQKRCAFCDGASAALPLPGGNVLVEGPAASICGACSLLAVSRMREAGVAG